MDKTINKGALNHLTFAITISFLLNYNFVLISEARLARTAGKNDIISELVVNKQIANGSIGNGAPKEIWKQAKCFQPLIMSEHCPWRVLMGYTYDVMSRTCNLYHDYSCQGRNPNFFRSHQSCVEQCKSNNTELICNLIPEPGFRNDLDRCNFDVFRWFHNGGECYQFIYTGCGGNGNNFPTRESCMHFCSDQGEMDADLPDPRSLMAMPGWPSDNRFGLPTEIGQPMENARSTLPMNRFPPQVQTYMEDLRKSLKPFIPAWIWNLVWQTNDGPPYGENGGNKEVDIDNDDHNDKQANEKPDNYDGPTAKLRENADAKAATPSKSGKKKPTKKGLNKRRPSKNSTTKPSADDDDDDQEPVRNKKKVAKTSSTKKPSGKITSKKPTRSTSEKPSQENSTSEKPAESKISTSTEAPSSWFK